MLGLFASTLGGPRVSIDAAVIADVTASPTNASAEYQLTNAGVVNSITVSGGTTQLDTWITPVGAAGSNYEVRATDNGPDGVSSGTTGSWLSLGTTRSWTRTRTVVGSSSTNLTIEIRHAVSLVVLDTASIDLTADKV